MRTILNPTLHKRGEIERPCTHLICLLPSPWQGTPYNTMAQTHGFSIVLDAKLCSDF